MKAVFFFFTHISNNKFYQGKKVGLLIVKKVFVIQFHTRSRLLNKFTTQDSMPEYPAATVEPVININEAMGIWYRPHFSQKLEKLVGSTMP